MQVMHGMHKKLIAAADLDGFPSADSERKGGRIDFRPEDMAARFGCRGADRDIVLYILSVVTKCLVYGRRGSDALSGPV